MSLTSKIVLILSAVVAVYALTDYALQRVTVSRSFRALEEADALRDIDRVVQAIDEEQEQLDRYCLNLASRKDTAAFAVGMTSVGSLPIVHPGLMQDVRRFRQVQLDAASFERDGIDLLFLCDPQGRVLWNRAQDPDTFRAISLRDFPEGRLGPAHPLLARGVIEEMAGDSGRSSTREVNHKRGIFQTERGPMLVSSRPILGGGDGPHRGTVIAGRFLGPMLIETMAERIKVDFDLWSLDGRPLPEAEQDALDEVASRLRPLIREKDERLLHVYAAVHDILRAPGLLVRANLDRRGTLMAATAIRYALVSTVTVALLMLLVLLTLLRRTVLTPITELTRNAVAFGKTEDASIGFDLRRNDEVGILSREFDNMLAKLAGSRAALVTTARAAGMSDIATGILHNVGNVLNSVNVSASMASRKARGMCVDDLERLSGILSEHGEDLAGFVATDPRGQHLQPFVEELAREMRSSQLGIGEELDTLAKGIEHIRELIDSQQSYVGRTGVAESVNVEQPLEEAIGISEKALSRDPRLRILREYAELEPILVDRHKLLEILVNLVQNARQAMEQAGSPKQRITLRTSDLEDRVRIEVRDTGPGIAREDLVRIFNLGFTTRAGGHGVGLHSAANAAKEMAGTLRVESEGPGHGACFVLDLPKSPQGAAAVAA